MRQPVRRIVHMAAQANRLSDSPGQVGATVAAKSETAFLNKYFGKLATRLHPAFALADSAPGRVLFG